MPSDEVQQSGGFVGSRLHAEFRCFFIPACDPMAGAKPILKQLPRLSSLRIESLTD
ncbi:MAG: hypothetical protein ACK5AM_15470 [Pirellulaceae bacterium]